MERESKEQKRDGMRWWSGKSGNLEEDTLVWPAKAWPVYHLRPEINRTTKQAAVAHVFVVLVDEKRETLSRPTYSSGSLPPRIAMFAPFIPCLEEWPCLLRYELSPATFFS